MRPDQVERKALIQSGGLAFASLKAALTLDFLMGCAAWPCTLAKLYRVVA